MAWTVALTVVFGVIIFVLGQLVVSLIIEPAQNLRRTIAAISHALIERANVIQDRGLSTKAVMDETSAELRKLSSQLQSRFYMVPLYRITAWCSGFLLPRRSAPLQVRSPGCRIASFSPGRASIKSTPKECK